MIKEGKQLEISTIDASQVAKMFLAGAKNLEAKKLKVLRDDYSTRPNISLNQWYKDCLLYTSDAADEL